MTRYLVTETIHDGEQHHEQWYEDASVQGAFLKVIERSSHRAELKKIMSVDDTVGALNSLGALYFGWGTYTATAVPGDDGTSPLPEAERASADDVINEVEQRLRNLDGYSPEDARRMALLHIDAYRTNRARRPRK